MDSNITSLHGEISDIEQTILDAEAEVRAGYAALAQARVRLVKARCEELPFDQAQLVDTREAAGELLGLWHSVLHSRRDPFTLSRSIDAAPGWVFRIQSDWVVDPALGQQVTQARISLEPAHLDSDEATSGMPRPCMPVAQTLVQTITPVRIDILDGECLPQRLTDLAERTALGAVEPPENERLGGSGE
jgi:hypothetical protein